ncbi:glycerophosphodiester phosphodiesterase [Pseudactinotalea sp. HY160]|uniref:glycerophosphodiester phosphodiesterase n=1 Tax=Pseudactinotalea sp. HY160 TaxID=2654490 RepID=UPI00128BCF25|nr:glycerophosphodiester phosphodiesterase family protein [Pseudactinotalea sp. HY160]MPV49008.1 glycerophosphodiester phosphodiesterase [Pseudactinotalea sp. HY160]
MTEIIAHRGNSQVAPPNTPAALEAAWRVGADAVEIDLQQLADGTAVVMHDETVDATTDGTGPLAAFDVAGLAALDAGSWFSPAFAGQRVPLFTDVLDFLTARPGIDLLLEIKGDWEAEALSVVLAGTREAGLAGRVRVQSFSVPTLTRCRELAPELRRELLVHELPADLGTARELAAGGINPRGSALAGDPAFVARAHAAGLRVSVWTLDEPEQWRRALAAGVDAIITNRPELLAGLLAGRAG